jgi:sugar lactone lactonase YvrE
VVLENLTISNGLDWSPDGSLAYYNDTTTGRVDVFDYERDAALRNRRPLVGTGARPDGLTVDAEGGVWVALVDAGAVRRYSSDGVLDDVVELPVTKVTACTFGGPGSTSSSSRPRAKTSRPAPSRRPARCSARCRA